MTDGAFSRSIALLGYESVRRLSRAHALVIGIGGVGSWCAEALVRTGLGRITLVDDDVVAPSNLNRQCPALFDTLGAPKAETMRMRLKAINPVVGVSARIVRFAKDTPLETEIRTGAFDVVVDAIDAVADKAALILAATEAGVPLVSSMGAARRLDPTRVTTTRFEKVEGDGLARALRQRFKRLGRFPAAPFDCVWSTENAQPGADMGSIMPVTASFGMTLAARAIHLLTA